MQTIIAARRRQAAGCIGLVVGLACVGLCVPEHSPGALLFGTALAGIGQGISFRAGLGEMASVAPKPARGSHVQLFRRALCGDLTACDRSWPRRAARRYSVRDAALCRFQLNKPDRLEGPDNFTLVNFVDQRGLARKHAIQQPQIATVRPAPTTARKKKPMTLRATSLSRSPISGLSW